MHDLDLIVGARPNFAKMAAIVKGLSKLEKPGAGLSFRLLHTGQHYDQSMSGSFFQDLGLPEPSINFGVNGGTQGELTAGVLKAYEQVLEQRRPRLCVVVGDVTSTVACALAAAKACVPLAHVEAGLRSGDRTMPEEINRIVTDSISDYFFTTEQSGSENLLHEGVPAHKIFFVGNTMIDILLRHQSSFRPPEVWRTQALKPKGYILLTLHRPANVDSTERLVRLLETIGASTREVKVVFPIHPRTASKLGNQACLQSHFVITAPVPYLEFGYLLENALAVVTDSGGITEEATVLGIPCMTVRDNTERPVTIAAGTNELVMRDARLLPDACERLFAGIWKKGTVPEKWDGRAGARIANVLSAVLAADGGASASSICSD